MVCRSILALSTFAVSIVSVSARADSLPVLAAAGPLQVGIIATGAGASSNPQVYTASFGSVNLGANSASAPLSAMTGPVRVTSSAFGGNDPSVSASALISGNPALYTAGYLTAEGYLAYDFEVTGPVGGYAPIDISASGDVSQSGPGVSGALAELLIVQQGSTSSSSYAFSVQELRRLARWCRLRSRDHPTAAYFRSSI